MASSQNAQVDIEVGYKVTAFLYESSCANFPTTSTSHYTEHNYDTADKEQRDVDIYANASCTYMHEAYPNTTATPMQDMTLLTSVRVVFGILYTLTFFSGIFLNTCVIYVVAKNRRLQSARNIFLLNLMVSDIILCVTSLPITSFTTFVKDWLFGSFMCSTLPLFQSVSVLVTSWSLTIIALDKFIHIMDPTKEPVTLRAAALITITLWLLTTLINAPYVFSATLVDGRNFKSEHYPGGICVTYCDEDWSWAGDGLAAKKAYSTIIMMLSFILPTVLISFCYWRIFSIVRRDMICDNQQFANSLTMSQKVEATRRKRRVNYILVAMVVTFILAWAPLNLLNLSRDWAFAPSFINDYPYISALSCHYIAMTTIIWNPLLFYWLTRQRRKALGRQAGASTASYAASLAISVMSMAGRTRAMKGLNSTITYDGDSTYMPTKRLISTPNGTSIKKEVIMASANRLQVMHRKASEGPVTGLYVKREHALISAHSAPNSEYSIGGVVSPDGSKVLSSSEENDSADRRQNNSPYRGVLCTVSPMSKDKVGVQRQSMRFYLNNDPSTDTSAELPVNGVKVNSSYEDVKSFKDVAAIVGNWPSKTNVMSSSYAGSISPRVTNRTQRAKSNDELTPVPKRRVIEITSV